MAKTSFTPLHDRILVRRVEEGESIRGGIIIPDSAKEKPQQGEVISVGKGKSNDEGKVFPLDVKSRRYHPVRQVFRHGDQAGRRRAADNARGRSPRHPQVALRAVDAALPQIRRLARLTYKYFDRHWPITGATQWQNRFCMEKIRVRLSCAASTFLPTR
jgi:hypothetical protein